MKILIFLALAAPILAIQESFLNQSEVDESHWQVEDCILANFTLDIQVHLNKTQPNATTIVSVPQDAKVLPRSHCGKPDNPDLQVLALGWTVVPKNDTTKTLYREISISFKRNTTLGYYGVERFYGNFQMAKWESSDGTKYFSNVTVDTFDLPKLLFHTPLDQSFTCPMWGNTYLLSHLHYRPAPVQPTNLPNSTVHSTMLRFDAFRDEDFPHPGFRVAMDCLYEPNDVVPIAVGVALAVLIVVVLVAYIVGRRRNQARGYQSV